MSAALRVVLLEHPREGGAGADLLARLVAMRDAGYRRRHPAVSTTADVYDAVSTHVLVCRQDGALPAPLLAFRSTVAADCAAAGLPFPLAPMLARPETAAHTRAVTAELEECRRAGRVATYVGLWTTDPALRADRPLFRQVWALIPALVVGLVRDGGIGQMLAGALPSQGTDRLLHRYGMRPVEEGGAVLPRFAVPHVPGETALLMRLPAFSAEVLAAAEAERRSWESRVVVSGRAAEAWPRAA